MKKLLSLSCALVFVAASPAFAKSAKSKASATDGETTVERSLFNGSESVLQDFGLVDWDCHGTRPNLRIVKAPAKGEIRFEDSAMRYTEFTRAAASAAASFRPLTQSVRINYRGAVFRQKCSTQSFDTVRLFYKAPADYSGKDEFIVDTDNKNGSTWRYTFAVKVQAAVAAVDEKKTGATPAAIVVPGIAETALNRATFTGEESQVGAVHWVNSDCSSGQLPLVRIVNAPQHGAYRLQAVSMLVDRKSGDPRANCNGKSVDAIGIYYKSETGFTGSDNVLVEADFKNGTVRRFNYKIVVR